MTEDADLEAIAKIGRELVTKEDVAAVSASIKARLDRLEKVFILSCIVTVVLVLTLTAVCR